MQQKKEAQLAHKLQKKAEALEPMKRPVTERKRLAIEWVIRNFIERGKKLGIEVKEDDAREIAVASAERNDKRGL